MAEKNSKRTWLTGWDPEDEDAWHRGGHRVARRNLILSVISEHIGFSVWTLWSVLVLFMTPETGLVFTPGEKFLLVATPTVAGALLRLPYSYAVTRFGGRDWTVFSTLLLLVPATLALHFVRQPGTPLWVFLVVGALAGVGGGTFASSMTNITAFFPQRHQGWALGLNAGGGNLGVAVVQLIGLLVIHTAGRGHPEYVAAVYLPLIVVTAVLAARLMDNVDAVRTTPRILGEAARCPDTWWISLLYIGTFGSFIGFGFAFGLVLQYEFGISPVQAMGYTFLGPLLGSLFRPLGGRLADRLGGARVTLWSFLAMASGTILLTAASRTGSFGLFVGAFTALFVLSGLGSGSTYKMIPAVFARRAETAVTSGGDAAQAFARARRLSGAAISTAGAVGALGGAVINIAFTFSYTDRSSSGTPAFLSFLVYYAVCIVIIRSVHLLRDTPRAPVTRDDVREASRV